MSSTPDKYGAVSVALANYQPIAASEKEDRSGWISYGDDNLYPQYLKELAETSPVHGALCKSIAQMVAGDGLSGADFATKAKLAVYKAEDIVEPIAYDLKVQGGFFLEVIKTMDLKGVAKINHLPFENCRLSYNKETGDVNGVWYSSDWSKTRMARHKPKFMQLCGDTESAAVCYVSFLERTGSSYYPKPDYAGGINYIELTRQIGIYHVNNIMNGLFPSFIIQHFNGDPDPDVKRRMLMDWEEKLSGARNAGKFIMMFNEAGTTPSAIETFPISDADKQYQFLSEESTRQIMVAHRVTSPLLFGIREGGGLGSNTDEMRQALAIFTRYVIQPMRKEIVQAFKDIAGIAPEIREMSIQLAADERPKMSEDDEKAWIKKLTECGETIDEEEWELIDESEAGTHEEEQDEAKYIDGLNNQVALASLESYANGGDKSEWGDAGLYKLRYAYSQNLSADTREFCREMVGLSQAGKVYRYEDIQAMGDDGVNGQFAPEGSSTYDIFIWKGGAFCHHFWKRQIYLRKRDKNGRILPNKGLENDKRVANVPFVPRKGREGVAPINTPSRGSLKYG